MKNQFQVVWSRIIGGFVFCCVACLVARGNENDATHSRRTTSSSRISVQSRKADPVQAIANTDVAVSDSRSVLVASRDTPQGTTTAVSQVDPVSANTENRAKKVSSDPQQSKSVQDRNSRPPVYLRPSYVTRYDVSTIDDLRYAYLLSPLIEGDDPTQWKLLNDGVGELKQFVGNALDASVIADTITTSMPIEGQKAFKQIDEVVDDCVQILGIDKPAVFIRSHPIPQAYVRGTQKPHILVLTSALIALYKDAPEELRFIIGHELGHIKCQHIQMKTVGVGLLSTLGKVNEKTIGTNQVLPTLALGRFLSWCREAEVSADRCGLLCCQDPRVAYNALARLLHGLPPDEVDQEDIDPNKILKEIREWESRPFVEFLTELKKHSATHPFVPERIAWLKLWYDSGVSKKILARDAPAKGEKFVQFQLVLLKGLASNDSAVDAHLRFLNENGSKLFQSSTQEQVQDAAWQNFDQTVRIQNGQPIFVEIWDENTLPDSLLGLFVVYPNEPTTRYTTKIIWNVNERKAPTIRVGLAKVKLAFVEGK